MEHVLVVNFPLRPFDHLSVVFCGLDFLIFLKRNKFFTPNHGGFKELRNIEVGIFAI